MHEHYSFLIFFSCFTTPFNFSQCTIQIWRSAYFPTSLAGSQHSKYIVNAKWNDSIRVVEFNCKGYCSWWRYIGIYNIKLLRCVIPSVSKTSGSIHRTAPQIRRLCVLNKKEWHAMCIWECIRMHDGFSFTLRWFLHPVSAHRYANRTTIDHLWGYLLHAKPHKILQILYCCGKCTLNWKVFGLGNGTIFIQV